MQHFFKPSLWVIHPYVVLSKAQSCCVLVCKPAFFLDLTHQKLLAEIVFFVAIWVAISLAIVLDLFNLGPILGHSASGYLTNSITSFAAPWLLVTLSAHPVGRPESSPWWNDSRSIQGDRCGYLIHKLPYLRQSTSKKDRQVNDLGLYGLGNLKSYLVEIAICLICRYFTWILWSIFVGIRVHHQRSSNPISIKRSRNRAALTDDPQQAAIA